MNFSTFVKINQNASEVNYVEPVVGFIVMFLGSMLTGFLVAVLCAVVRILTYMRENIYNNR